MAAAALATSALVCSLSDLIDPTVPETSLEVAPGSVVDSAVVGEETLLRLSLAVRAEGRGPLSWSVAKARGAAWLTTEPGAGSTPGALEVSLAPAQLESGAHHDTLIFTAVSSPAPAVRVPVELRVREPEQAACPTLTLTSASERSGRLDSSACASMLGGGRVAARYRFRATAGDTLSATASSSDFDPVPPGRGPLRHARRPPAAQLDTRLRQGLRRVLARPRPSLRARRRSRCLGDRADRPRPGRVREPRSPQR